MSDVPEGKKPDFVVMVHPFRAQVAVFSDNEARCWYFENHLGISDHGMDERASYGMASQHQDDSGVSWHSMHLPEDAGIGTVVHECSHIVDYLMDAHGVPISIDNTEIRAYMLEALFMDVMEFRSEMQEATQ